MGTEFSMGDGDTLETVVLMAAQHCSARKLGNTVNAAFI